MPDAPRDPDTLLLLAMHKGDEAAARQLWDKHAPGLIATAAALLHNAGGHAAAHDLVQQVFCTLLQTSRSQLAAIRDTRAYFARAVRNAALNERRSIARRDHHTRQQAPPPPSAPPTGSSGDINWPSILARLDPAHQEVLILKHVARLTLDQIAIATGESRGVVAGRYKSALEQVHSLVHITQEAL